MGFIEEMRKLEKSKKYKNLVKKLKPFWKEWEKAWGIFRDKEMEIEKRMSKEIGENLEFFYGDEGGCAGIGHRNISRRNHNRKDYFPLISSEKMEDKNED